MNLAVRQIVAYGAPGFPLALLGIPLIVYLPTAYAELPAFTMASVGLVLLAARLWDMVSDPLIGLISDRMRLPFGRRRGLMLFGAPMLLLGVSKLFSPPDGATLVYLFGWSLIVYTGWTLVTLPYLSWGAELSSDYHERTKLTSSREAFVIAGTIAAIALPAWAVGVVPLTTLQLLSLLILISLPVCIGVAIALVREPKSKRSFAWPEFGFVWRDRPFRRLMTAFLVNGMGNAIPASLFLLYVEHVLEAAELAYQLLAVYFLSGLVGLAIWLPLSKRFGKHRIWAASIVFTCLVFACVPFLASGHTGLFLLVCLLTGLSLGSDMALPASIQADVLAHNRATHGKDEAGLYFGLWGMATKLALALGLGLAFPLVSFAGFDAGQANDAAALFVLALAYGALPIPFKLAAAALIWRFSTDDAAHKFPIGSPPDEVNAAGDCTGDHKLVARV